MEKKFILPEYTTAEEIRRVRKLLHLTQKEFGRLVGCSTPTIERWETSEKPISGPIVLLLLMLESRPETVAQFSVPEKKYPLRLWYMYKQTTCTIIDVDEMKQLVEIHNYHPHLMFRAFGSNEHPDFQDYTAFLESRCFPASRDKMKLILKDLGLPFYDPFMIISKTEGRMAEDDFWIRIER